MYVHITYFIAYILGSIQAAVVPASTSILSRSEADHSLNTNYLFYRYPHIGSTTSTTFQPTFPSNFLQYQTSTTQLPRVLQSSAFQDVDTVSVLFKNGMFEPLFYQEQNEKRSANSPLIPKEFQIFEAVPSDHLQN